MSLSRHSRWVNRKDPTGKNIFTGGFLGLDNIGQSSVHHVHHSEPTWTHGTLPPSLFLFSPVFPRLLLPLSTPSHLSGIFDRSRPLPTGGILEQADGTAWMAFYCAVMLDMALELALYDPVFEDMASKFFEHFVMIVDAMNQLGEGQGLWNEDDGFYYDHLR